MDTFVKRLFLILITAFSLFHLVYAQNYSVEETITLNLTENFENVIIEKAIISDVDSLNIILNLPEIITKINVYADGNKISLGDWTSNNNIRSYQPFTVKLDKNRPIEIKIDFVREDKNIKFCNNSILFPFCVYDNYSRPYERDVHKKFVRYKILSPREFSLNSGKSTFSYQDIYISSPRNTTYSTNIIDVNFSIISVPLNTFKYFEGAYEVSSIDNDIKLNPQIKLYFEPNLEYKLVFFIPILMFIVFIIFEKFIKFRITKINILKKFEFIIETNTWISAYVFCYIIFLILSGYFLNEISTKINLIGIVPYSIILFASGLIAVFIKKIIKMLFHTIIRMYR